VKVTIRPYDQRDAGDLADVFFRSVRQAARSDYTAAQVKAWLPERPSPGLMHQRASDGRMVLVAGDTDYHRHQHTGKPIRVGNYPTAMAMTPDGRTLYIANSSSHTVTPISTATNTVESRSRSARTLCDRDHAGWEDRLRP